MFAPIGYFSYFSQEGSKAPLKLASEFDERLHQRQWTQTPFPQQHAFGLHQSDHLKFKCFFVHLLPTTRLLLSSHEKKETFYPPPAPPPPPHPLDLQQTGFRRLEIIGALDGSILSTSSRRDGAAENEEWPVLEGSRKSQQDKMRGSD